MSLWNKTDANGSKPKYLSTADKAKAVFVSAEEAVLKTNKDKGITGAGWWLFSEYTDSNGNNRYKAENLVAMAVPNSISGDAADDAIVADTEVTITIDTQPTNEWFYEGNPGTFTVAATASSGTVTYQWQTKANTAGAEWTNISGANSDSYTATDIDVEAEDNTLFRVVLGSTSGAAKVISNEVRARYD